MRVKLREIAEAAQFDPRQAILDHVGDMSQITLAGARVLVGTYISPAVTPGGIIKPDRTLMEDRFQGKIGLILAMGPLAFVDDDNVRFGGFKAEVDDWVIYRPSDGFEFFSVKDGSGVSCRILHDQTIIGKVTDPAVIY